jgi:hypothetical protein
MPGSQQVISLEVKASKGTEGKTKNEDVVGLMKVKRKERAKRSGQREGAWLSEAKEAWQSLSGPR